MDDFVVVVWVEIEVCGDDVVFDGVDGVWVEGLCDEQCGVGD